MTVEHGSIHEGNQPELAPQTAEVALSPLEAYRKDKDPQLVNLAQRLDAALASRLPDYFGPDPDIQGESIEGKRRREEEKRIKKDHIHVFQFREQEGDTIHNRLLYVGPTPLGFGMTDDSVSLVKYHATPDQPRQRDAIIGQMTFIYKPDEIISPDASSKLKDTTTGLYFVDSFRFGDREALLVEQPDVHAYIHGKNPMMDERVLLQKGVTIDGAAGFAMTANRRRGALIDLFAIAEHFVSVLEDEQTEYIESYPVDFHQDKEHQISDEVKPEEIDRVRAFFKEE